MRSVSTCRRFNPLHCGAVVASLPRRTRGLCPGQAFQSPSLRGSGRFLGKSVLLRVCGHVSIPFIAGQWSLRLCVCVSIHFGIILFQSPSLRGSGRFDRRADEQPHPGALVSIPFIAGQWSLHGDGGRPDRPAGRVSIPFIAGQWSLQHELSVARIDVQTFQSPSLRGSGRFTATSAT